MHLDKKCISSWPDHKESFMLEIRVSDQRLCELNDALDAGRALTPFGPRWPVPELIAISAIALHIAFRRLQQERERMRVGISSEADEHFTERESREVRFAMAEAAARISKALKCDHPASLQFRIDWADADQEPIVEDLSSADY
jgi:hypothetical protein